MIAGWYDHRRIFKFARMQKEDIELEIRIRSNAGRTDRAGDSNSLECRREWSRVKFELLRMMSLRLRAIIQIRSNTGGRDDVEYLNSNVCGRVWSYRNIQSCSNAERGYRAGDLNSNAERKDRAEDSNSLECRTKWSRLRFEFARMRSLRLPAIIRIGSNVGGRDDVEYPNSNDCWRVQS